MTASNYWPLLEEAARAEAAALGDAEPDPQALLDRILAAAPPPAGIARGGAEDWALHVAVAELRRLGEARFAEAAALEKLDRRASAHGCPDDVPVIPWLIEHGLVREVDGRLELLPLGPRSVA